MVAQRLVPPVLALLALCVFGCGNGGGEENGKQPARATAGPRGQLVATPDSHLRRCRAIRLLAPACPRRLPAASSFWGRRFDRAGRHYRTFNISAGLPHLLPERNAPPLFVHVVIEAGDLRDSLGSFGFPTAGPVVAPKDGLTESEERTRRVDRVPQGVFLGAMTCGGGKGVVVLAPPYNEVSSLHGDHLIFRWRRAGREYALSLHAWEPFSQSFAMLRAMVESLHAR